MEYIIEYDKSNLSSIEDYAQRLIGKIFRQISQEDDERQIDLIADSKYGISDVTKTKRNKGNLGQLIEEKFFSLFM